MFLSLAHGDEEIERTIAASVSFGALTSGTTIAATRPPRAALWARLPAAASAERERSAVFSPLGEPRYALGLETIYEGYLVHYGRPRLFAPADDDTALLLGDYLYAHGARPHRGAAATSTRSPTSSELISLCSQLRAEDADGDGPLWAATAALLGRGRELDEARAALRLAADARAARGGGARGRRRRGASTRRSRRTRPGE